MVCEIKARNTSFSYEKSQLVVQGYGPFGITGLQTDNTLNIGITEFLVAEDAAFAKAEIKICPQKVIDLGSKDFNGLCITIHDKDFGVSTTQKG
ncbi:uncharacterized protein F4822DRAFT_426293 [Hypoxylon trugodes]|uniref:uncharacterized protein n=1 Tax=Hypoxylon trugodes TaxID=326681 RepID=UPI00219E1B04|nr:uncharacterized protein F4822DRAFT_426293 [Hypoxylon trugodes]KAI1390446.1 hypothetical protein F4822DRAFT_426293 [Hypoxylon trugodes]